MIRRIDHRTSIFDIFKIEDRLVINEGDHLVSGERKLPLEVMNAYRHDRHLISTIAAGKVSLFNKDFELLRTIDDKRFDPSNTGVQALSEKDFAIFLFIGSNVLHAYVDGKKASETQDFNGKIVSPTIRINYAGGNFDELKSFRCSNLADTTTFFTFDTSENEEVVPHFIVHDDQLIFPLIRDLSAEMVAIQTRTGVCVWRAPIESTNFHQDQEGTKLVSFWTRSSREERHGRYQIVDLLARSVESLISNGLLVGPNIHTPQHLQYLYGENMYFVENRQSYVGKVNPVRFGRMNIKTKEVDLLHEITESPISPLSEVVEHESKIFVRNANNELFIYQIEDVPA